MKRACLGMLLLLTVCASLVLAQTETGQITGTVTDPSGAAVPGVTVNVKNVATGAVRTFTTDNNGVYVVPSLQPAQYQVSASAAGFATIQQSVTVAVGSRVGLDLHLEVGKTETVIQVTEQAVQVNTETQTLQTGIGTRQVLELPTLTRNPYALVSTVGNVSDGDPNGSTTRGAGVSINGQRSASTSILLDGVPNNDDFVAGIGQPVPLDSVEELSVLTSNFTAEYGRASGGIINVATKSGTNQLHGTAYEFNRVSDLGSNGFNNNANSLPKPVYDRNQFGFSVGAPLIKNKLFVFENTEWTRVRSGANVIALIPTPQFIAAANPATQNFFSTYGQLRPGLQTLQTYTKAQLLSVFGTNICKGAAATGPCNALAGTTPMFSRVTYGVPSDSGGGSPQNTYNLVGRMDYNLTDRTQIYGRYALYSENDFSGTVVNSPYAGFDSGQVVYDNALALSVTHTFSPRLVSQTKLDFNRLNLAQPLGDHGPVPTLYYNSAATSRIGGVPVALPGYSEFSPGNAIPFGGPQNFLYATEDLSYTKGKHQFRFGGQYDYLRDNRTFGAYEEAVLGLGATSSLGVPTDNFLNGQLATFQAAVSPQGKLPGQTLTLPVGPPNFSRSNRYHEWALYAQDSWKVTPHFTVNLGVRYEYFGVQHNKNPQLDSNYYLGNAADAPTQFRNGSIQVAPSSPIGELWKPSKNNWAPRVGWAWDIFGDGKTSFRGGYGIGYERNFGNVTFNVIQNPPGYAVVSLTAGVDLPSIPISTSNAGPLAGSTGSKVLPKTSLRAVDSNIHQAYAHFYSASIEHQFGGGILGALEYSGSAGEDLYSIFNPNRPGSGTVYLNDPCSPVVPGGCASRLQNNQVTNINFRGNGGISNYNALNTRFDVRNLSRYGLELRFNYTWSHAIDNLSTTFSETNTADNLGFLDPFNPLLDRGNADFDITHRVTTIAVWQIPVYKSQKGFAGQLLGGWQLAPIFTARSGNPFTLYDCSNAFSTCPRAFFDGPAPVTGVTNVQVAGQPNTFNFYDLTKLKVNSNYANAKVGVSDFGPFPGNMTGRNAFRMPGSWNLDMGVYKSFRLKERLSLQMRFEAYNLFNHANFFANSGNNDVSSTDFMDGFKNGNRNIQLAAKFIF